MEPLKDSEYIITAYADPCYGPGWSNRPVSVIIKDRNTGVIRENMLQPEEQNSDILLLYELSAIINGKIVYAVNQCCEHE